LDRRIKYTSDYVTQTIILFPKKFYNGSYQDISLINSLLNDINTRGKAFISNYFELLNKSQLTQKEELTLIDFAINTIKADDQIEYSEIKFFKNIRHRLKISDENILKVYQDLEMYLEEDIIKYSFLDKITKQYLDATELPQFDLISIDNSSLKDLKKNE
jgi:uncharacterized tellurite resistance protein B-like protein